MFGGRCRHAVPQRRAALIKAKATGERYLFFTQAMTERVPERLSLENRLRQALDNEKLVLHYQPKVTLANGKVTSEEELIRWNDLLSGLVAARRFIPILEETGLIHEVRRWAPGKAVEDRLLARHGPRCRASQGMCHRCNWAIAASSKKLGRQLAFSKQNIWIRPQAVDR